MADDPLAVPDGTRVSPQRRLGHEFAVAHVERTWRVIGPRRSGERVCTELPLAWYVAPGYHPVKHATHNLDAAGDLCLVTDQWVQQWFGGDDTFPLDADVFDAQAAIVLAVYLMYVFGWRAAHKLFADADEPQTRVLRATPDIGVVAQRAAERLTRRTGTYVHHEEVLRAAAAVMCNMRFLSTPLTCVNYGHAVYACTSGVANFSCDPSCGVLVDPYTAEAHVIALRDMEDGDEITVSPVPVGLLHAFGEALSRRAVANAVGMRCKCLQCRTAPSPSSSSSSGPLRQEDVHYDRPLWLQALVDVNAVTSQVQAVYGKPMHELNDPLEVRQAMISAVKSLYRDRVLPSAMCIPQVRRSRPWHELWALLHVNALASVLFVRACGSEALLKMFTGDTGALTQTKRRLLHKPQGRQRLYAIETIRNSQHVDLIRSAQHLVIDEVSRMGIDPAQWARWLAADASYMNDPLYALVPNTVTNHAAAAGGTKTKKKNKKKKNKKTKKRKSSHKKHSAAQPLALSEPEEPATTSTASEPAPPPPKPRKLTYAEMLRRPRQRPRPRPRPEPQPSVPASPRPPSREDDDDNDDDEEPATMSVKMCGKQEAVEPPAIAPMRANWADLVDDDDDDWCAVPVELLASR